MMKANKPRSSEEVAKEVAHNISTNSTMPKAKIKSVAPKKALIPKANKSTPPKEAVSEVKISSTHIKAVPPSKKVIEEDVNDNKEHEISHSNQLEEKIIKRKAPQPKTKTASQIAQNQVGIHKEVHNNASSMIHKPKVVETKNDISNQTSITYTFTEKEMSTLVSAIVEGLSTQFVTKNEAAKVVIGTLSKIAMKDVSDEIVNNSIETATDYMVPEKVNQGEIIKKDTFFSKLFNRKGGAS